MVAKLTQAPTTTTDAYQRRNGVPSYYGAGGLLASGYAKDGSGNVYIRGHVLAGTSTTGHIEPRAQVTSRYGVSIVAG